MSDSADKLSGRQDRAAKRCACAALLLPGGLALFVPWRGQSEEFLLLAGAHLLGLALVILTFAALMKLFAVIGSRHDFGSRLVNGFIGVGLVAVISLRWMAGFDGAAGQPALVIAQLLSVGLMLSVTGCLFSFMRAFATRIEAYETKTSECDSEVAS